MVTFLWPIKRVYFFLTYPVHFFLRLLFAWTFLPQTDCVLRLYIQISQGVLTSYWKKLTIIDISIITVFLLTPYMEISWGNHKSYYKARMEISLYLLLFKKSVLYLFNSFQVKKSAIGWLKAKFILMKGNKLLVSYSCKWSGHVLYLWFYYDSLTLHTKLMILKDAKYF